jgi:integrase
MARKRANKEGTVFKLPSGRWCAQLTLEGKRMSKTCNSQKEGLDWIRKTRGLIDDGMNYASTKMTLGDFLKDWLAVSKPSQQKSTWVKYEQICRCYIIPYLGQVKIQELRPEHIQGFYRSLLEKKVGTYSVIKVHMILHSALQQATRIGMINRNPASFVQVPKPPATEMAILNESQVSQLLVAANGHRWLALFHLSVVTGARQMELLGLKWTDLDWIRQSLRIERQLVRPDGNGASSPQFSAPKTKFGKRSILLGGKTIEVLRSHYQRQQAERLAAGEKWQEHGLIFSTSVGSPIHPRNLLRDYKRLLKDAGLPAIRFHDLRHTAASLMLNNNIPPIVVSRRLGHAKASITLDIYGHLIPSMQEEAAEKIDELIMPVAVQLDKTKINR